MIGKSRRDDLDIKNEVPGPGCYILKGKNDGPKYTMPKKYPINDETNVPGPGIYKPMKFIAK